MNDDVSWGEIFSPEELATLPPVHSDPVLNVSVRGTSGFLVARAQKFTSWKDLRRFVHLGGVGATRFTRSSTGRGPTRGEPTWRP